MTIQTERYDGYIDQIVTVLADVARDISAAGRVKPHESHPGAYSEAAADVARQLATIPDVIPTLISRAALADWARAAAAKDDNTEGADSLAFTTDDLPGPDLTDDQRTQMRARLTAPDAPRLQVDPDDLIPIAETDEDGDGHCRTCGAYAYYGLLCDRCRSELAGVED